MRRSLGSGGASSSCSLLESEDSSYLLRLLLGCSSFLIWSLNGRFFEFPTGCAAFGLLLIRLVSGVVLVWQAFSYIPGATIGTTAILYILSALAGAFLAVGYRTQLAGGVTAAVEMWLAVFSHGDPLVRILLAAFAAALAFLGPGAWSMDARLAGWKRIEIPRRLP